MLSKQKPWPYIHLSWIYCFICKKTKWKEKKNSIYNIYNKDQNNEHKINVSAVWLHFLSPKFNTHFQPSTPPRRVVDRTTTQIMTSPVSLLLLSVLTVTVPAEVVWPQHGLWLSGYFPGGPWITRQVWRAPTPAGAQPTMEDLLHRGL